MVFVVGKGTVKDLGLGLGSELRALRMESKHKIRGPKAQIGKLGFRTDLGEGRTEAMGRRGCYNGLSLSGRQHQRQVG